MNGPQIVRIRVRGEDGARTEQAIRAGPTPVPGLVVNEDPEWPGTWNITHVASGAAVAVMFPGPEAALYVASRLAGVCDWTMTAARARPSPGGVHAAVGAGDGGRGGAGVPAATRLRPRRDRSDGNRGGCVVATSDGTPVSVRAVRRVGDCAQGARCGGRHDPQRSTGGRRPDGPRHLPDVRPEGTGPGREDTR